MESSGHLNKASLLVTSSAPTTDGEHRKRDLSPSASVGGGRDRSMSVGGAELGSLRSLASKGSVAEDLRAPELLAFEDMTLREHYKVSEKLFEVCGGEPRPGATFQVELWAWHELASPACCDDACARSLIDVTHGRRCYILHVGPTRRKTRLEQARARVHRCRSLLLLSSSLLHFLRLLSGLGLPRCSKRTIFRPEEPHF